MRYPITVPTLLVLAGSALAEDSLASKFDVHGFFTQGYTKSTNNTYLADDSKSGSWDLSSVALNVGCQVTDRFRLAAQFYGENLWQEGETQDVSFARQKIQLDLLFAQYSVRDWLGVRVGRIKQPFGLYNETQDFDNTRVSAILPQSVYDVRAREYHFAVNGIGIYGSVQAGQIGSFDYQAFYGNQQIPSDGTVAKQYQSPDVGLKGITLDRIMGAQVFWNAPSGKLEGLKLGFSYRHTKNLNAEAYLPNNIPFGQWH